MLTRRRIGASAVLSMALLAMTGAVQAQDIELTYSTFLDPANDTDPRVAAQAEMLAKFEELHPGVKVKILVDPTAANLARGLKSGSGEPDIGRVTSYSLPELVLTGNVAELDGRIAADGIENDDWLLPLETAKFNGHFYGMPQDFRIPLLMYRAGLLEKAGVAAPTTWDEVCATGSKLTGDNLIGYAVPLGNSGGLGGAQALGEYVLSTMLAPDGKYFAEDGREIAFSRETFVRAAQTIKELYKTCGTTPETSLQFGYSEVHDGLRAGTVAMATFGLARFRALVAQGAGDDLHWAPAPSYSADDKQTVFGFRVVLNANSAHPDEAWELIKFATGPEGQAILAKGGEVVARKSAYDAPYFKDPAAQRQKDWAKLVVERGQVVSYSVILTKFHEIVGEALQRMVLRDGSPEDAYDEVISSYERELARVK
ncbi:ABC transporter substrate-binding protein [Fuscibacter oryzae]|uniref:Sugar ABC transporter substrate-binding protein n=1 Tax=Fuscibacter oryzae TaxID=2803939 RepID=A0A8J7SWY7_9RHOB|nr:sugar ABC transporter substrate-binding protein [Fuscibacter oryzae]MBL4929424.1 sugar ABC transporter substrate-binding protein [Fuscibacter oryzae]